MNIPWQSKVTVVCENTVRELLAWVAEMECDQCTATASINLHRQLIALQHVEWVVISLDLEAETGRSRILPPQNRRSPDSRHRPYPKTHHPHWSPPQWTTPDRACDRARSLGPPCCPDLLWAIWASPQSTPALSLALLITSIEGVCPRSVRKMGKLVESPVYG